MCCFAKAKFLSVLQVFRTKTAAPASKMLRESVAWQWLRPSPAPGRLDTTGDRLDTTVTLSVAFTFFKSSEADTCGKPSLKVEVQYSIFEADKQGSFVRTCDSCLLDFIGKCT